MLSTTMQLPLHERRRSIGPLLMRYSSRSSGKLHILANTATSTMRFVLHTLRVIFRLFYFRFQNATVLKMQSLIFGLDSGCLFSFFHLMLLTYIIEASRSSTKFTHRMAYTQQHIQLNAKSTLNHLYA